MIETCYGDLLTSGADALVNTVNTVGIMGKGIALQFKKKFPANFTAYEAACKRGEVRIGAMFVFPTGELFSPRFIINYPTKEHWRDPSRVAYVKDGLHSLINEIKALGVASVAVPPLGCGNGGLNWDEIKPLIVSAFEQLPDLHIKLYPPF